MNQVVKALNNDFLNNLRYYNRWEPLLKSLLPVLGIMY